jgi:hypothetical protein
MPRMRLIPRIPDAELFPLLENVMNTIGWGDPEFHDRAPDQGLPAEYSWWDEASDRLVSFTFDEPIGFSYLIIKGPSAEQFGALMRQSLPDAFFSQEELLDAVDNAPDIETQKQALSRCLLAAPETSSEPYLELFERCLRDPDRSVRYLVIWCCGYAEWPELVPLLKRVAKEDPEPILRAHALDFARSIEQATGSQAAG